MTDTSKAKKHKTMKSSRIIQLLKIIPALFSFFGNVTALIKAELLLIRKQIITLVLLLLFLFVLMLSTWIALNILAYLYLINHISSAIYTVAIIGLINFILFIIVCCVISISKVSTTFPETRKVINDLIS